MFWKINVATFTKRLHLCFSDYEYTYVYIKGDEIPPFNNKHEWGGGGVIKRLNLDPLPFPILSVCSICVRTVQSMYCSMTQLQVKTC